MENAERLSDAERRFLLGLARKTIEAAVRGEPRPVVRPEDLPASLRRPADTFVTLYSHGELRGCIGSRTGSEPLYGSVMDSAEASALRDPRFAPVVPSELDSLTIQISVLTPPQPVPITGPDDVRRLIEPFRHGVCIRNGPRKALYLPQVWEHFRGEPDIHRAFFEHLSRKAGDWSGNLWREPGTQFEIFETETFSEADLPHDRPRSAQD